MLSKTGARGSAHVPSIKDRPQAAAHSTGWDEFARKRGRFVTKASPPICLKNVALNGSARAAICDDAAQKRQTLSS